MKRIVRHVWVVMEDWKTHRDNPCPGGGTRLIRVCGSYRAAEKVKGNNAGREIHREEVYSLPNEQESPKPLTPAQLKKRKAAADSLHGIWAHLPEDVQKMLMEKTY